MTGAITRPRETGSALAAAGEITKAWLTDQIDTAIEKDAHNILSAMARLTSTGIDLHAEATGQDVRPSFELPAPEPPAKSLGCDLPMAIGWSRRSRSPCQAVGCPDRNAWSAAVADAVADVLACAGLLQIAGHLC